MTEKKICVAITGASGFQYALRLLDCLLSSTVQVHLLLSDAAREVAQLEADICLPEDNKEQQQFFLNRVDVCLGSLTIYDKRDWLSPVASGSADIEAMVVCPCSTGTLAAIANGHSTNLIERAATVCLKEKRQLIILPREMPLSTIQIEHMLKLSTLGVSVLPASPGFYHKPASVEDMVDFVVARILQQLGMSQSLIAQWGVNPLGEA